MGSLKSGIIRRHYKLFLALYPPLIHESPGLQRA
jgi:hypothetical protein